ncbi:MAG: choice-of-anchor I family protein [Chitinophagaceae bacterium]
MRKMYKTPPMPMVVTFKKIASCFLTSVIFSLVMISNSMAQAINFSGSMYNQDFQSMDATNLTPATVTNTTMLQVSGQPGGGSVSGWYVYQQASGTPRWGRSSGSSSTGSFYVMYDLAATPNRAIGSQGSNNIVAYIGVVLQNTSGGTINSVTLSYDAVMNRNPATTVNPYPMSYLLSSSNVVTTSATGAGTFNDAAGVWTIGTGFSTPSTGTGAPGTQAAISPLFRIGGAAITQTLTGLNWANGQYLYIRWKETDDAGADATAGVDNFSITNNTPVPTVNLSVSASNGTEASQTVITVTATASSAVSGNQTVSLGVSGSGINAGDYSLSNSTITIPDGATTGTVTFTIVDDAELEATETATLTISNPSSGISLGTTTTQNITITDNEVAPLPTVNLSVSATSGTEVGQTVITVTATASSAVSGTQTVSLGVSGTGITLGDYTLNNSTITIPDGGITGSVTFTIADDNLVEGTETAILTISNPSAGLALGATTVQNISIADNDIVTTLVFNRVDTTVSEGVGIARVWLRVTGAGNTAGTVDLAVSNYSTATGSGTDYSVTTTLNIPANTVLNQLISIDFTINDDGIAEADEYIICKLTNGSNVIVSSTAQSTLYVKDNDKTAPAASNQLGLNFVSSFSNGASGTNSAEISAYDAGSKRLFIANSVANKLDIVNLSNPSAPFLITSINLASFNGSINSVDVHNGIVALALEGLTDKQANGKIVFVDTNGVFISEVAAGAMPDMITFNHAGTKVYTANEGEPNAAYTIDPEGSITVVDISSGVASPIATTINFNAYDGQEAILRSQGIRIYGLGANTSKDFEPEYITISDDDSKAWVTLQENNALVELDLATNTIVKLIPLGYKDHSLPINPLDASDQTFGINLSNFPVKGMYLPDAIASYSSGGNVYLITANEGDARAYTGFNEESRVSGLTLDPTIFPNGTDLKNNGVLGRLNATNKLGDTDGDGDIDEIYVYGSRSFSIWNPSTSSQVYDSKDDLERITANSPAYSQFFNMSNTIANTAVKNRSDDKGPEPEGVTVGKIGGKNYAFVALERIGGVMVYDVTNPSSPVFVNYANSRTVLGGDRGPEGIIFVPSSKSPNGKNLVILSNEISSTVSVYEIAPCVVSGIADIASVGSPTACAGNTVKLYNVNSDASYTYQWYKNDSLIANATDSVYLASQSGNYKLVAFNSGGCVDTSEVIVVTIGVDTTPPAITAPATVNVFASEACSASGINLGTPVTSDNCGVAGVTNNAPSSFPLGSTTVTWTVTDSSGNSATATQTVTVSDTTKPAIYLQGSKLLTGITGISSSQTPYLLPSKPGIRFKSILTVGDGGTYKMAGIPDGLGAFDNGNGTFTVLMNHEINNTLGIARAHGSKGAFVSKWIINKSDLSVVGGSDLMQQVYLWDTTTRTFNSGTFAFSRFCSADLPGTAAFYNSASGKGTTERIFMNGEESGIEGKAVGHIVTGPNAGKSYELPYLGKFAWENSVASPASGNKTVVAGMDDGTGGQVYFYIGTKTNSGTDIDKAGLNNGKLFGVKVSGLLTEVSASVPAAGTRFDLANLGIVANKTGATLNAESVTAGVTTFLRPEDGAWDPKHPNDFYFATTNAFGAATPTRLWRLRFDNILTPETGGTIEAVLTGTESNQRMFDNLSVDSKGYIHLQEDVGNQAHIGKIWQYNIATDSLMPIAYHDSTRFITGQPNFLTQDEESSGIIDVSDILGQGMYLLVDQAHYGTTAELVEGGQLLAMYNPYTFGNSTAPDTIRVNINSGTTTTISLGTPATADNCSVASVSNNAPASFPIGTTIVTWTVTDGSGNMATANQVVIVTSVNAKPIITITNPVNGASYPAGSTVTLNVNASDPDGTIVKVTYYDGANKFGEDSVAPYQYTGNELEPGSYVLTARAFDNNGDSTISDTVRVTITACAPTGSILVEGYTNIGGNQLINLSSSPKYPSFPDVTAQLTKFEYGPNIDDNYGGRVRGYVCVPLTGDYIFYIASDNQSELWLSTDDNPANIRRIAYVEGAVGYRSWFGNLTQRSIAIRLIKGGRYYIESVHKEGIGNDHLSVSWRLPNGVFEGPIPGSRLSPIGSGSGTITGSTPGNTGRTFEEAMSTAKGFTVKVSPNPSVNYFIINTRSNSDESVSITVVDVLGRVMERKTELPANGVTHIGNQLSKGIYFVEVTQGSKKQRIKLVKG